MKLFRRGVKRGMFILLQKTFNTLVAVALLLQPVAVTNLSGGFSFSSNAPVALAEETDTTAADVPAEEPAAEEESPAAEEESPAVEEETTPAEEEVVVEETTPVEEAVVEETDTPESTPAPETPVSEEEEVATPVEETVVPAQEEETVTPAVEVDSTEVSEEEAEVSQETAVEEVSVSEEVAEVPASSLSEQVCLSASVSGDSETNWTVDGDRAVTNDVVELGVRYVFPLDKEVSVTFTCLPADESKRAPLSIERIKSSDINLPAGTVAVSEYAYDITTDGMDNGDFKYDLTLPKSTDENVTLSYIEKSADEVKGENLSKDDVKEVDERDVDNTSDSVEATDLDHFTIFFGTVDSDTTGTSGSTTLVIDKPASTVSGDFLIAGIIVNGGSTTVTAPSGWTLILRTNDNDSGGGDDAADDVSLVTYYKVAGGSEPSNYTWTFGVSERAEGGILRYTGVDTSNPINVSGGASDDDDDDVDAPSVTTTAANTVVVAFFGVDDNSTFSTPIGTTERFDRTNTNGNGPAISAADFSQTSAGATGTKTSDVADDDDWVAQQIALNPAAVSDTTPDAFAFTDQTNVALSSTMESDQITVAGIDAAAAISVTGGEYAIGAGAYTSVAGTVNNGDLVKVRHTSSASNSTAVDTVLTIGGVSDTFTSTTLALVLDTTAPSTPTLISPSNGAYVKASGLILDWSDETDPSSPVTYDYQSAFSSTTGANNGFTSVLYGPASQGTTSQIDASGTSDGTYYWQVRACDNVGNCSDWSGPWQIIVDSTAPTADPSGFSSDPAISTLTNDQTVTVSWTTGGADGLSGVDGYSYDFTEDAPATPDQIKDIEENVTEVTSPTLTSGTWYFNIRTVDNAGNWTSTAHVGPFLIDATAPAVPSLTSPADGVYISATGLILNWSDETDPSSPVTYDYQSALSSGVGANNGLTAVIYGPASQGTTSQIDASGTSDGTYYWQVRACDNLGNCSDWSGPWKLNVDSTAPSVPVNGTPHNTTLATNEFDFDWDDSTDASLPITYDYQTSQNPVSVGGVLTTGLWTANDLPTSMIHSSGAGDGTWYWQVRAQDAVGNYSAWSEIWNMTIDTTAPAVPALVSPADGVYRQTSDSNKSDWTDVTDPSSPITYWYESSFSTAVDGNGEFVTKAYGPDDLSDSEIFNPGEPEGTYYWHVKACDNVGNCSDWSTPWQINIDNTDPTVDAGTDKITDSMFSQDATASDSFSGIATYAWSKVSGPGAVTFGTPDAEDTTVSVDTVGTYVLRLTVTDNAGNVASDDFTKYRLSNFTAHKWNDFDASGIKEEGEMSLSDWQMELYLGSSCEESEGEGEGVSLGTLGTDENGNATFTGLLPGEYSIKESVEEGWRNITPLCQSATFTAGEDGMVSFGNQELGTITINKLTNDEESDEVFFFTPSYGDVFTLVGNGGSNFSGFLVPGTYTITEQEKGGWELDNLTCVDNAQNSTSVVSGATATITLGPGNDVTCTYANDDVKDDSRWWLEGGGGGNGGGVGDILGVFTFGTPGGETPEGEGEGEEGAVQGAETDTPSGNEGENGENGQVLGEGTENPSETDTWSWWWLLLLLIPGYYWYRKYYNQGV